MNDIESQIAYADRVIISKVDLLGLPLLGFSPASQLPLPPSSSAPEADSGKKAALLAEIKEQVAFLNPTAAVAVASHGVVPVDFVLGVGAFDAHRLDLSLGTPAPPPPPPQGNHSGEISSLSLEVHDYLDGARLNEWIASTLDVHHHCIYRTKGICAVVDEKAIGSAAVGRHQGGGGLVMLPRRGHWSSRGYTWTSPGR
jgi:G3E family GTPase